MRAAVRKAWAATRLRVWPTRFAFATFATGDAARVFAAAAAVRRAYVSAIVEGDELSLTVPWQAFARAGLRRRARAVAGPYRVITFEVTLDLDFVGFLAPAAARLAAAKVSILPQCGYRMDHLLVQEQDLGHAVAVLQALIEEARASAKRRGAAPEGATPR